MDGNTSDDRDRTSNASELIRLAHALPEPHLLVSMSGDVVAANPAAAREFGIASSPVRRSLHGIVTDSSDKVDAFLRAASGSTSLIPGAFTVSSRGEGEKRLGCSGGLVRPAAEGEPALVLVRFRPHEDTIPGFLMLNERIRELSRALHERRQMQEALEQRSQRLLALTEDLERGKTEAEAASRSKTRFLAAMSHELRTPLNGILGYADLLSLGLEGPLTEGQAKQVARIRRGAAHLAGIIEQILEFARLDGDDGMVHIEAVDLVEVAREAIEMIEPAYVEARLHVAGSFPAGSVLVRADPVKVRQILLNLLSNALRFTRRGGVTVAVRDDEEQAYIDVRDTGVGIDPAHLELIFEPYWQLERERGGTGLGLPVTRQLARRLGGDISVTSLPDQGATFTLSLPGRRAAKHILLVEDDPNAQEIYHTVLLHGGFTVTVAEDGGEAVRLARTELPDLILLDIDLPVLDGWKVAERLHEEEVTRKLKIMGVSAGADPESFRRAESLGFEAYHAKPFPPAELLAVVQRLTGADGAPVAPGAGRRT